MCYKSKFSTATFFNWWMICFSHLILLGYWYPLQYYKFSVERLILSYTVIYPVWRLTISFSYLILLEYWYPLQYYKYPVERLTICFSPLILLVYWYPLQYYKYPVEILTICFSPLILLVYWYPLQSPIQLEDLAGILIMMPAQ